MTKSRQSIYNAKKHLEYKARLNKRLDSTLLGLPQKVLTVLDRENILTFEQFNTWRCSSIIGKTPQLGKVLITKIIEYSPSI